MNTMGFDLAKLALDIKENKPELYKKLALKVDQTSFLGERFARNPALYMQPYLIEVGAMYFKYIQYKIGESSDEMIDKFLEENTELMDELAELEKKDEKDIHNND